MAKTTARVLRDLSQIPPTPALAAPVKTAKPSTRSPIAGYDLAAGFTPTNVRVLAIKDGRTQVWAYDSEWNNKVYFHLREVYKDGNDQWKAGKGVSVQSGQKDGLIKALTAD